MDTEDRLKLYAGFADISRRWTATMDSKGTFFSALNGGVLAFIWGSLKIDGWELGIARYLCVGATLTCLFALACVLVAVTPREKVSILVGKKTEWSDKDYKPFSYYGFVAKHYRIHGLKDLIRDCADLDEVAFTHEALEQHFNISLVIQKKSSWVFRAAFFTICSITLTGVALVLRLL